MCDEATYTIDHTTNGTSEGETGGAVAEGPPDATHVGCAARLALVYQAASRARKQLLLDEVIQKTGYARTSAIRLLNDPPEYAQRIRRPRQPSYGVGSQRALVLAWKAAHFVCAKRLMPSLPVLVEGLERWHHQRLTEEERRQVQTMSVATAERFLLTQPRPRLSGFSLSTPGMLRKSQIPVCFLARTGQDFVVVCPFWGEAAHTS